MGVSACGEWGRVGPDVAQTVTLDLGTQVPLTAGVRACSVTCALQINYFPVYFKGEVIFDQRPQDVVTVNLDIHGLD